MAALSTSQLRRALDRLDNEEVRSARRLARQAQAGALDVLYLGDSTTEWVAPADRDRRPLWRMVRDGLSRPDRFATAYGGSYGATLFDAYLRLVLARRRPRLVIVPLWYRGCFLPWRAHPVYSRAAAARYISAVPSDALWWRIHHRVVPPTPADWTRYQALAWTTFADFSTIGEYTTALKDADYARRDPDGRAKLIYAYHQTHRLGADDPALAGVQRLGATLRSAGCPVVVYETPVSVETGRRYWGGAFEEVAQANFARLRAALRAGYDGDLPVLEVGTFMPADHFLDPTIADEHLNERGRNRLAGLVLDRVRALVPSLVGD